MKWTKIECAIKFDWSEAKIKQKVPFILNSFVILYKQNNVKYPAENGIFGFLSFAWHFLWSNKKRHFHDVGATQYFFFFIYLFVDLCVCVFVCRSGKDKVSPYFMIIYFSLRFFAFLFLQAYFLLWRSLWLFVSEMKKKRAFHWTNVIQSFQKRIKKQKERESKFVSLLVRFAFSLRCFGWFVRLFFVRTSDRFGNQNATMDNIMR